MAALISATVHVARRAAQLAAQVGFRPADLRNLMMLPRAIQERARFLRLGGVIDDLHLMVSDYADSSGSARGHYFHQDLLVASHIYAAKPKRHIDVGSRIDGFVAHVAAFREIEVLDIRPLPSCNHPNIVFRQMDFSSEAALGCGHADSVSCLHTLEHFGLGRYGDPVNPKGHLQGFANLLRLLSPDGTLYLSFPIAYKSRVEFNAHRVFAPDELFTWPGAEKLRLVRFDFVDDAGLLFRDASIGEVKNSRTEYGCGIYTLHRVSGK